MAGGAPMGAASLSSALLLLKEQTRLSDTTYWPLVSECFVSSLGLRLVSGIENALQPVFELLTDTRGTAIMNRLFHGYAPFKGAIEGRRNGVLISNENGEAVATRWLEAAVRRRAWLILYTHDVTEQPSPWGCTPQSLERLAEAAARANTV